MFCHAFHFSMEQPKASDESVYSSVLKYSHLSKEPRGMVLEQHTKELHIMSNIHQQFDKFLLSFGM